MEHDELWKLRHTSEHVLMMAMKNLGYKLHMAMGPATNEGFYFDFELLEGEISEADFKKIEREMQRIINKDLEVIREEIDYKDALKLFKGNPYKEEWIEEYKDAGLSVYWLGKPNEKGSFVDLCKGPHVKSTKEIKAFKLLSIAGAYWRGDEKNKMLTRIYGTSFYTKDELADYLNMLEEAKKRDHRKIGKEMQLFAFDDEVGGGLPLWLPKGTIVIDEIEKYAKEQEEKYGYTRVRTPHIAKEELYIRSGHLPYYKKDMFPPMQMDNEVYYLKAMNCPHHHKIYATSPKSYKDLPIRLAEYGHCYRYEQSGELFGLMRVRSLCMNDAHIYCSEEQFFDEFESVIKMYYEYFDTFGIDKFQMRLSKHSKEGLGKKYVDNEALWIKTEDLVRKALVNSGVDFVEADDEAAFYGPKIDVQIWSAIGKEYTLATNQLDFAVPERFNLAYTDAEGNSKTPICIHRAPLSTHERLMGLLIEHYAGAFPVWMHPEQVRVIPISDDQYEYSINVMEEIKRELPHARVSIDSSKERLQKKIRNAQIDKVPYMIIIGNKEVESQSISLRLRTEADLGSMKVKKFSEMLKKKIETKDLKVEF